MPENNIADIIRSALERNKGFMTVKKLLALLGADVRRSLGIKSGESSRNVRRKLEQATDDSFMFHAKGNVTYILIPCEPSELVLGLLSEKKAFDTRTIRSLPFTKAEFVALVNELLDEGKAAVRISDNLTPRIYRVSNAAKTESRADETVNEGEYTREKFREAFENSDKGRTFVRIFRMRRYLGWPREVFDGMTLQLLRDGKIFVHQADPTVLAKDEYDDGFMDEFGHMKGTMTWNE